LRIHANGPQTCVITHFFANRQESSMSKSLIIQPLKSIPLPELMNRFKPYAIALHLIGALAAPSFVDEAPLDWSSLPESEGCLAFASRVIE
jgi:hypothetical protein